MGYALALVAAAVFGTADFIGGLAARRTGVLATTLVTQVAGLAVVLPILLVQAVPPGEAGLAWGALAGFCGCAGLLLFFRALAGGTMSAAAPVTAVVAAGLPVLAGVALGERPDRWAWLGMGAGLLAVVLVSWSGPGGSGRLQGKGVALALGAGAGFGLFAICLSRTSPATGFWPLAGARLSSLPLLAAIVLAGRVRLRAEAGASALAALSGVLDMSANVLFLLAVRHGVLALVAVLISLYPAVTVLLALGLLRERLRATQLGGIALALAAVLLIAAS